jgi:hypothetical protein
MFKNSFLLVILLAVSNFGFAETIACNFSPDDSYSRIDLNTQNGQAEILDQNGKKLTGRVIADKTYPRSPAYHMDFNDRFASGSPALRMFSLKLFVDTYVLHYAQFKRVNSQWVLDSVIHDIPIHCSKSS